MRLDAVDDRTAERPGDADADLEPARVGRLVAEQDEVERSRRSASSARDGRHERAGGGLRRRGPGPSIVDEDGPVDADRDGVAQLLVGLGRADGQHGARPAVLLDEADRLLDRALLVRAGREAEVLRVDAAGRPAVSVMRAPGAGTRLTQARTRRPSGIGGQRFIRASSGSNSGVLPATATRTGYWSSMYMHAQLGADDRVLGREVGQQQVLPDGRAGAGRGDVRRPALAVDDALAVER